MAGGEGMFAIGMKSGAVKLYQQSTCGEIASLDHGEPVRSLRFSHASHLLASAGYQKVKLWSSDGKLVWEASHQGLFSKMTFTEVDKTLVVVNRHNIFMTLNVDDGTKRQGGGTNERDQPPRPRRPSQVSSTTDICPKVELLAVACSGFPPQIWSIQDDVMITSCHLARDKPEGMVRSASKVLFNPNPAIELLAAVYEDGELAIFNTWAGGNREVKSLPAEAFTLASTSDGRTLASGDALGSTKLWDFETLTLLYYIKSTVYAVRSLAFSTDGFRLYDIAETHTKVWEPTVLARKSICKEGSVNESVNVSAPVVGSRRDFKDIMQIHAPPDAGCVFAGMEDGSVVAYDWDTGDRISTLYSHGPDRARFVTNVSWNHFMIASVDLSKTIEAHDLTKTASNNKWVSGGKQFEVKLREDARGLFLHPKQPWLLVFQTKHSMVIDTRRGAKYSLPSQAGDDYRAWLWLSRISPSSILLGARSHSIDIYKFDTLGSEWPARVWHLTRGGSPVEQTIDCLLTDQKEKYIAVLLDVTPQTLQLPRLLVYDTAPLGQNEDEALPRELLLRLPAQQMRTFLGFYGNKVVYLDHRLWIQAVDMTKIAPASGPDAIQPERYLFVPQELIGSRNAVDGLVTAAGTVVFPKEGSWRL